MKGEAIQFINEQLQKGYTITVYKESVLATGYRVTITNKKLTARVSILITECELLYQKDDIVLLNKLSYAINELEHKNKYSNYKIIQ